MKSLAEELAAKMVLSDRPTPKQGIKPNAWTPEHDAVLREHYLSGGSARVAELLGRTANSVQCRAAKIGVKGDPLRSVKIITQRKRSTEWREKQSGWKPPQDKPYVEPIITSETKVTLCPHGVDMRYRVTSAPRVVDSRECRPWAALV